MLKIDSDKFMAQPALAENLPYKFLTGINIESVIVDCFVCSEEVHPDNIRGEFTTENQSPASFGGYAHCLTCSAFTPIVARFRDDGTMLYREGNSGWISGWFENPPGLFKRFVKRIVKCLKKNQHLHSNNLL